MTFNINSAASGGIVPPGINAQALAVPETAALSAWLLLGFVGVVIALKQHRAKVRRP